jgi:DNA-binding GntR family transcriptional regulator
MTCGLGPQTIGMLKQIMTGVRKGQKGRTRRGRGTTSSDALGARKSAPSSPSDSPSWRIGRPKGTAMQRVYSQVREDIIGLRLPPGADLDESSLEARFGVSRTPVREALIRLASDGLIVLLPNRGARITHIDISDVPQLFEALELCQRAATRWAAERRLPADISELRTANQAFLDAAKNNDSDRMGEANKDFHMVIGRLCGNRYFESLYSSLLAVSLRLARTAFAYAPRSAETHEGYYMEVVRQHDAMIQAIENKDADEAETLARIHTDLFRDRIDRYLNSNLANDIILSTRA